MVLELIILIMIFVFILLVTGVPMLPPENVKYGPAGFRLANKCDTHWLISLLRLTFFISMITKDFQALLRSTKELD